MVVPRRLPLAEALRVRSPCLVGYENMTGEGPKRFCASCNKQVHDVAALTRREAEELIRSSRGTLCFHIHVRRADGAILLADGHAKPKPQAAPPTKRLVATVAATALAACAPTPASTHETTPQTRFEVSVQPVASASPGPLPAHEIPSSNPSAGRAVTDLVLAPVPVAKPSMSAAAPPSTASKPPKASEPAKGTSPPQTKPPAKHYVVIDGQGPWSD